MRGLSIFIAMLVAAAGIRAATARQCASPADQAVYDILALRTELVVLALSCDRQGAYNRGFVLRFRPALQANDRAVSAYFHRLYGRAGEARKDTFVTDLANAMAQDAERQNRRTCTYANRMFNELAALRSYDQLGPYAAYKNLTPRSVSMCP